MVMKRLSHLGTNSRAIKSSSSRSLWTWRTVGWFRRCCFMELRKYVFRRPSDVKLRSASALLHCIVSNNRTNNSSWLNILRTTSCADASFIATPSSEFTCQSCCRIIASSTSSQWRRKRYGRYGGRHTNLLKFGQLIFRKIIKIVATRCQILRLQCAKNDFAWGYAPDPSKRASSLSITALPRAPNWNKRDLLLREGDGCRTAERSLNVLKRLQTYLRNSLSRRKLNSC